MSHQSSNPYGYKPLVHSPDGRIGMKENDRFSQNKRQFILYVALSISIIALAGYHFSTADSEISGFQSARTFRSGKYKGDPWRSSRTVSVNTLGETKFARCDVHSVKTEDGTGVIDDWIFMEEMDAVNVAVVTTDGNFVVFEQSKYAIPGLTLSPVGGFIDAGEAPWESARREVMEELGLGSPKTFHEMRQKGYKPSVETSGRDVFPLIPKMARSVDEYGLALGDTGDDPNWIFLGRYRTAANRGGGFIYTYLLKNAVPILPKGGTTEFRSSGDDEAQVLRLFSVNEIEQRLADFQEIKWAATVSMSLLHLKS